MVLCVRTDLGMGKGKVAAQCGHATLGLYKKAMGSDPSMVDRWEARGQAKVALKVAGEEEMLALKQAARSLGLQTNVVLDAGRTQIAPNTRTVLVNCSGVDMSYEHTSSQPCKKTLLSQSTDVHQFILFR